MRVGLTYRQEASAVPYREALRSVGLEPVNITPESPVNSLDGLSGLVVSGGTDVDPAFYGETPHPETDTDLDPERDALEIRLLREAIERDVPVLAICRGLQVLNVARQGSLVQHLESPLGHDRKPQPQDRPVPIHTVDLKPASHLARIAGDLQYGVNSRHHQAINQIGQDLAVVARAPDGVVEAVELPGKSFVVGVQWHPENCLATNPPDRRLFEAFAGAARQKARRD